MRQAVAAFEHRSRRRRKEFTVRWCSRGARPFALRDDRATGVTLLDSTTADSVANVDRGGAP